MGAELRRDPPAQRGAAARHPGEERAWRARSSRSVRPEGRRFLCHLHGRAEGRDGFLPDAARRAAEDRRHQGLESSRATGRAAPGARRGRVLRVRIPAGLQGRDPGDRRRRPGRTRAARPRLLPEGRRPDEGPARALSGPRGEDAGPGGSAGGFRPQAGEDRHDHRDGARPGLDGQGRAPRPEQDLPPTRAHRSDEAGAPLRVELVLHGAGHAGRAGHQRAGAWLLQRHGQAGGAEGQDRGREDLPALEGHRGRGAHARQAVRGGALPPDEGAHRGEGHSSPLEALRADDRPCPGRSAGPQLRHHHHRRRRQEDRQGHDRGHRDRLRPQPRAGRVDGRRRARCLQG